MAAFSATTSWAGPYEDCILQNMRGVQAQGAAGAIALACREKTTPKKCREQTLRPALISKNWFLEEKDHKTGQVHLLPFRGVTDQEFRSSQKLCADECARANYWSRTFGECSTD